MIRVDSLEKFPISVALIDECTGELSSGQTVCYNIREANTDNPLSPPVSGTLIESTVEQGIYRGTENISIAGEYIIYCTCSGFNTNTEEIIVNPESLYDLTKQHNVFVEDVPRTSASPTASQIIRRVPPGKTDFIINKIKGSSESDWSTATISGAMWAWYRSIDDDLPFRMGPES